MTDTTDRDQLAQIISHTENLTDEEGSWALPEDVADEIIRAGWRPPPRVVTTWEEVLALKEWSILGIDCGGHMRVYERQMDDAWCLSGWGWLNEDWLPATVLWEPETE